MENTKYLAIAAAALALAACDKNNDDFNIDNTKDTPITIASAGVAELTTRAITEDNKLVGTSADNPATIGVFVTGGNETKYNATNVKWTHDGTSWSGESTMLYEGTGSQQKIYAYSPYSETTATDGTITVTASAQTDWLVATSTDVTGSSVSLTMTHALTKLVLIPSYGTEITDQTITSVEVGGMYSSGKLNIFDNTWSGLPETADATLPMTDNELLVIPMTYCASFPITVTMADFRTFKVTISLAGVSNMLAAGTRYNIKLQIGQDKVTLGGITAEPWTSQNGGELATEQINGVINYIIENMRAFRYIALAALTISLAACSQDEDFAPQTDGDAIKINATISTMPQTRLAYGTDGTTTFTNGDQIRVINQTRSGKSKSDATYTFDGSAWTPTTDTDYVVWDGTESNTFYGIYPATAEYATFTIPYDQSGTTTDNQITAADWMTATTGEIATKPDNNTINLTFKHQLTKVTVNVTTWNSEFSENNKTITDPIIWSRGSYIEISYGTGTDGADEYTSDGSPTAINPVVSGETFTAIVAPVKYDALTRFMTFTVDGQDLTVLTKNDILTDGLEAGKHYTFDLTVGKEAVEICTVNVTDWTPQTIDGGVAELVGDNN